LTGGPDGFKRADAPAQVDVFLTGLIVSGGTEVDKK